MAKRTVVTSKRRERRPVSRNFSFTRAMMPAISGNGNASRFIKEYRARSWDAFETLPIPNTNDEPWRRTNLHSLETATFQIPNPGADTALTPAPEKLLHPLVGDDLGGQVLLLPGGGAKVRLNPELASRGVIFTDLATAEREHSDVMVRVIGQIVHSDEGKFASLAAAMAQSGVLVYIPRGVRVEQPLHSILWGPGVSLAYFSHLMIWLEDEASLTYLHEAASLTETKGHSLHAGIVEIHVGSGANLRFVELQSWGKHVWNFSHERAVLERDAILDWIFGAVGSHVTKNFSDIDLIGPGSVGRMSGFYFTDGDQHLDHDTQQNHLAPHTTSDLLYKGALKGRSRSVWQGMIYVAPGAQQTDGYQANRNLVLSDKARADSIPGLEILADDVRCTHGVTVGKIDPDQIFYLLSRGIAYPDAERLIVEGFFEPILQRIPFEGVRTRFRNEIIEKMG